MITGKKQRHYPILAGFTVLFVATMVLVPRIAQNPDYHYFADTRTLLAITNFWNVISNLPFVLVGLVGLALRHRVSNPELLLTYTIYCSAVLFVGL